MATATAPAELLIPHLPEVFEYQTEFPFRRFYENGQAEKQPLFLQPVSYVSVPNAVGLILPGVGEDLGTLKKIIQYLGLLGIRMAGVVPPYLARDEYERRGLTIGENIQGTLAGSIPAVIDDINERDGRRLGEPLKVLYGTSQGSGEATLSAWLNLKSGLKPGLSFEEGEPYARKLAKHLIGNSTVGVTSKHFEELDPKQRHPYKTCVRLLMKSSENFEPNRPNPEGPHDKHLLFQIIEYAVGRKDALPVIKDLKDGGYKVKYFIADEDWVCNMVQAEAQLGGDLGVLERQDGYHASLLSKYGRKQALEALAPNLGLIVRLKMREKKIAAAEEIAEKLFAYFPQEAALEAA